MDHADAAMAGHRDGEPRLGDGVHGCAHQGNSERDAACESRRCVDRVGQHVGRVGHQQNVVEGQPVRRELAVQRGKSALREGL